MQSMRAAGWDNEDDVGVVNRMALVLETFGPEDRTLGVSALARRTGLSKSTVHRLVQQLQSVGFLERDGTQARLGLRLFELGQLVTTQRTLREVATPFMADLREATRQTVHLAILVGRQVLYIEILESANAPRFGSRVGGRLPAHATAVGKAILANSPQATIGNVLTERLSRVGPRTITVPNMLHRQLARAREEGFCLEYEESGVGVACVAAPIIGADGVVGAMSVSGWGSKMDLKRLAPAVQTASLGVTRSLRRVILENDERQCPS